MSYGTKIIIMLVLSTLLILIGAYAKIQGWEQIKPLMLIGLVLQTITLFIALYKMAAKKNQ